MLSVRISGLALLVGLSAQALAWEGSISFTEQEKADHARKVHMITAAAADCLNEKWVDHVEFYHTHKAGGRNLSKYYGNRRYVKGDKPAKRADGAALTPIRPELRKYGFDPRLEEQLTSISCVDLARMCLRRGFQQAGQLEYWERIDAFNKLNGNIGPVIQIGLQALGWKQVYWNPDPRQNAEFDKMDKQLNPANKLNYWGYHSYTYNNVKNRNVYYEYKRHGQLFQYIVDDKTTLTGFGTSVPKVFKDVPFFIGFAHLGYHVFVGFKGEVIEAHSVRSLFGFDNLEFNPFNPLAGGAPMSTSSEVYRSGLIAVPPGYL